MMNNHQTVQLFLRSKGFKFKNKEYVYNKDAKFIKLTEAQSRYWLVGSFTDNKGKSTFVRRSLDARDVISEISKLL